MREPLIVTWAIPEQYGVIEVLSQLCHRPVVTYCMVYHYTKRAMLARLLANKGPAIYVVHFEQYLHDTI